MNSTVAGTPATGSRDRLLDAAEELAAAQGATSLTLDAVARTAGVSKGGLLHHFPTKEALLEAMLQRHIDRVDARVAALQRARPDCEQNPLLAHVLALLETLPAKPAVGAALIAASASDPTLMQPCRQQYAATLASLESLPCGFERAATLLLAVDGLVLGELIHVSPLTPEQRARIVAELERQAAECARPC
jgi:AcrR family transcriptional regulator